MQLLMPRASLAPGRTFLRSAVHDPAPLPPPAPSSALAPPPSTPSAPLSSPGASSLRRDAHAAFDAWTAAQSDSSAPTPLGPGVFFPAALTNFGEGAGVAGTRGQRWVPKKGVTDFLSKIAHQPQQSSQAQAQDQSADDDASSAHLPQHLLSPAEQHSAALVSPRHAYHRRELAFSNIRPETPSSKSLDAPAGGRRAVRPLQKAAAPKTAAELQEAQAHAADLAAVRTALRKLGAAAGNLNTRQWFRGVEFDGHTPLSAAVLFDSILPQLGVTNLGRSEEMSTNPRNQMLKALLFGDASTVEYQTLIPRLQPLGASSSSSSAAAGRSEPESYLRYWNHLPPPPPKQNPCPTAMAALRTIKERMDTRGLGPFLHNMGLLGTRHGDATEVTTPAQLRSALARLHLDLPAVEFQKLVAALDPANSGAIPYAELFKLAEMPAHWMHRGHAKQRELASRVDAQVLGGGGGTKREGDEESSRRKSATDVASVMHPSPPQAPRPSTCSAAGIGTVPPLSFSLELMPPLFQSVHTARSAHRSVAATATAEASAAPAGSQSAREYSRYAPGAAALRSERTPHIRHTPLDSLGSFGRPVEGSVVRPVSARLRAMMEAQHQQQQQQRQRGLPPVAGGALSSDSASHRNSLPSVVSDSRGRALSSLYADEHERFTPRAEAIRQMQMEDKQRKVSRVAAYGARLDSHEQRVLCAYERDALTQQRQAANSILDKVQQKVAYMRSLQSNVITHGEGKRTQDKFAEECKQQEQTACA